MFYLKPEIISLIFKGKMKAYHRFFSFHFQLIKFLCFKTSPREEKRRQVETVSDINK